MPAPPARMRSAKVPCGLSSTSTSPARYCSARSGLPPMKLQITLRTWRFFSSTASPWPWLPQLLLMMVSPLTPRRAIASMQASALPRQAEAARHDRHAVGEPVERGVDVRVDLGLHRVRLVERGAQRHQRLVDLVARDHQRRREVEEVVALVHVQVVARAARAASRAMVAAEAGSWRDPGAHSSKAHSSPTPRTSPMYGRAAAKVAQPRPQPVAERGGVLDQALVAAGSRSRRRSPRR